MEFMSYQASYIFNDEAPITKVLFHAVNWFKKKNFMNMYVVYFLPFPRIKFYKKRFKYLKKFDCVHFF